MAWRRPKPPRARLEYPEWVRDFHPEGWDAPGAHELAMMNGHLGYPWPRELREIHAHRRWASAAHEWFTAHPAAATQRFNDIVERHRERASLEPRPLD